jgi:serine protease AprX
MTGPDDREQVAAARAEVRRVLGSALADKATDAFCLLYQRRTAVAGLDELASVTTGAATPATATVVEFGTPTVGDGIGALSAAERQRLATAARAVRRVAPDDVAVRPHGLLRQALIASTRTARYQLVNTVYDEIERLSGSALPPGPDVLGDPRIPTLTTQVCWLNGTVRTWVGPAGLADVVADPGVTGVDVPRRLMPDAVPRSQATIGLAGFRGRRQASTGRGTTVAVIDSEVAPSHPSLAGRVVHRRNYTAEPWGNPDGHGTAVAGIIAADDADNGGVAPAATIYNYKVVAPNRFFNADDFQGALALQQALEDGADVANCSWNAGPTSAVPSREARAVDEAAAHGMVTVKSAGNKGPGAGTITTPGDAATAIVVGATDLDGTAVPDYSARGSAGARPGPDVVAPGGTLNGQVVGALVGGGFGAAGYGTSFAAPLVTGLVAVLLEREPGMLPAELRQWVRDHANAFGGVAEAAQGLGLLAAG